MPARFRVVLMTSLATVVGLLPLAVKLGTGGEAYVPMARAIIGGMLLSVSPASSRCRRCGIWRTRGRSTRAGAADA